MCLCHLPLLQSRMHQASIDSGLKAENQWNSGSSSQNSRWDEVREKYVVDRYFFQSSYR